METLQIRNWSAEGLICCTEDWGDLGWSSAQILSMFQDFSSVLEVAPSTRVGNAFLEGKGQVLIALGRWGEITLAVVTAVLLILLVCSVSGRSVLMHGMQECGICLN